MNTNNRKMVAAANAALIAINLGLCPGFSETSIDPISGKLVWIVMWEDESIRLPSITRIRRSDPPQEIMSANEVDISLASITADEAKQIAMIIRGHPERHKRHGEFIPVKMVMHQLRAIRELV